MTPPPRLNGTRLLAARLVWLAVTAAAVGLAIATLPDFIHEAGAIVPPQQRTFSQLTPAEAQVLQQLGLPVAAYVAFVLAWIMTPLLVFVLVASVIFQRRSDDSAAFRMSLLLVVIGAAVPYLSGITVFRPGWQSAVYFVRALGALGLIVLSFVFPDGHFVPRATRIVVWLWVAFVTFWAAFPDSPYGLMDGAGALTQVGLLFAVLGFGTGFYAQVYRYRRISSPIQRQQAKVFAYGFGATAVIYLVAVVPYRAWPLVSQPGWPYFWYGLVAVPLLTRLALALVPLSIAFAILRYRLWDIDIIIRRTLIYAVVTGALGLVYALAVIVLQPVFALLTGRGQSQLSTVVSTLAVAALFGPLRGRVQTAIDRRFYRRRYDAARTLAAFANTAHDEVDVNRLGERLVNVVQDTLQPGHVSLWLRAQPGSGAASRQAEEAARDERRAR
jgi:hypothetical protein